MSYEIQKSPEQNKPLTLEALQALTAEKNLLLRELYEV